METRDSTGASSALVDFCLARIVAGDTYAAYDQAMRIWAASAAVTQLEQADPAQRWHMVHTLSRAVWKSTPHPAHRFGPAPLPVLERNAPCHCGSGQKYKQCCLPMEGSMPKLPTPVLGELLALLPPARWAELPGSRVDPGMVAALATGWLQQGKLAQARALLEPWFVKDRDFLAKREQLFDLLLDVYSAPGLLADKDKLIQRALFHGDRPIRSAALHRACTMAADRGDFEAGWELFRQALRNEPGSVHLSHLEVLMLVREGRDLEARERARFWLRKLAYLAADVGAQHLLAFLHDVAERGGDAVADLRQMEEPASATELLRKLTALLQSAPPLKNLYRVSAPDARGGSTLKLRSLMGLKDALESWRDSFVDPEDVELDEEPATALAESADPWLHELLQSPQLFNTFEVLDDLSRMVEGLSEPVEFDDAPDALAEQARALLAQLGQRATALLKLVLADQTSPPLTLPWRLKSNQRVLRLLASAVRAEEDESSDASLELLNWALALDPNDEQVLRLLLSRCLVARGDCAQVQALIERYPQSRVDLGYNAVLALFLAGQLDAARDALADLQPESPHYVNHLLRGDDEEEEDWDDLLDADAEFAQMYRDDMQDLWVSRGALNWLRAVAPGLAREG